MPGIIGVVNLSGSHHKNTYRNGNLYSFENIRVDEDSIKLTKFWTFNSNFNCFTKKFENIVISIVGEIYGKAKKSDKYESSLDPQSVIDDIFLALEINTLSSFLERLDGVFSIVIYDSLKSEVKLISDRFGLNLMYYKFSNGFIAFSNEVNFLISDEDIRFSNLNVGPLKSFVNLGYFTGEETWFDNIKLMKPASIFTFCLKTGKIASNYYWSYSKLIQNNLTFNDTLELLYSTIVNSTRARFSENEKVGISLSGGLDSRLLLSIVNREFDSYNGYSYTFGLPNSQDVKIAKEVVERTNWKHREFQYSDITVETLLFERRNFVIFTGGMLNIMHMHGVESLGVVSNHIDVNLNGFLGDVIAGGGHLKSKCFSKKSNEEMLRITYGEALDYTYYSDSYFNIDRVDPMLFNDRWRRFTNVGVYNFSNAAVQRLPFTSNEMMNWSLTVPENYRLNNWVYSEMLKRYFPKFYADIKWQKTGRIVSKNNKISKLVSLSFEKVMKLTGLSNREFLNYDVLLKDPTLKMEILKAYNKSSILPKIISLSDLQVFFEKRNISKLLNVLTIIVFLDNLGLDND